MPLVQVDVPGSSILRGVAIPFHEYAIILDKAGDLYAETFDEESIPRPPQNVPLLVSHDRDRPPAGKLLSSVITRAGLGIEAKLVGTDEELEGWRRRFDNGLMVGLSIGFRAGRAIWEPPGKDRLPIKRVRDAEVLEVSLVNYPAYSGAATLSLNARTAHEDQQRQKNEETLEWLRQRREKQHQESEEILEWWRQRKASQRTAQTKRRT